jgi:hypothetical protein
VFPTPTLASLLPKLRDQYAEFLDHVSLVHLRLLASPTCVGLRYGHPAAPQPAFLARRLNRTRVARRLPSPSALRSCPPTALDGHPQDRSCVVSVSLVVRHCKTGPECQPAVHRLRLWGLALGSASPCADCHGAGTLGFTVSKVFTWSCAYSFRHPHFPPLQANVSTGPSLLRERSPTPDVETSRPSFGGPLNPDHSRRIHAGRVSYYALFKGMAASKPTSSLSRHGHILRYTQRPLRGLSCGSGFFPSRRWTLSLSDCLPRSI